MHRGIGSVWSLFAVFCAALPAMAGRPVTANLRFAQTAMTPITIGNCSGMNPGCTGVYGIDWLSDGRMVLLTSDVVYQGNMPAAGRARSKVSLLSGLSGPGPVVVQDIATHFKLPTGVVVVNDSIYVADMDTFYLVPSNNPSPDPASLANNREHRFQMPHPMTTGSNPLGFEFPASASGPADGQGTPLGGWTKQNSFWHQYMYSPYYQQGKIYAAYSGATRNAGGHADLVPVSYFGGAVLAFDPSTTQLDTTLHRAAGGLRSPGGFGNGPGYALASDNQGGYRPMCELFPVKPFTQQYFGYQQAPGFVANWAQAAYDRGELKYEPPMAVMEWSSAGWRSTTQPLHLKTGPYAGDWLVGDATTTGIARVAVDSLADTTGAPSAQAAVMWFVGESNSLTTGTGSNAIHRLSQGPDGAIYAGVLRRVGNWPGGVSSTLMYKYVPDSSGKQFEILKIRSLADGYELLLSEKVDPATAVLANFSVVQRNWVRQMGYGDGMGPNVTRPISAVWVSDDSLRIRLVVPGIRRLNQERRGDTITHWVTKFTFSNLVSAAGRPNFTNEATYSQNWISSRTWDGGGKTTTLAAPSVSALGQRVWLRNAPGSLSIHVDGRAPHVATLRDFQGKVLARSQGGPGEASRMQAPASSPMPYLLEVRSGSETYRKPVVF